MVSNSIQYDWANLLAEFSIRVKDLQRKQNEMETYTISNLILTKSSMEEKENGKGMKRKEERKKSEKNWIEFLSEIVLEFMKYWNSFIYELWIVFLVNLWNIEIYVLLKVFQ